MHTQAVVSSSSDTAVHFLSTNLKLEQGQRARIVSRLQQFKDIRSLFLVLGLSIGCCIGLFDRAFR